MHQTSAGASVVVACKPASFFAHCFLQSITANQPLFAHCTMGPNFVLLFVICATSVSAVTDVVQANLYVTDSPAGQAYGANVTAGEPLVADFQLRDLQTNATLGNSLGYCILLRNAGPNQCQYTIQFASGTIQVGHSRIQSAVHAHQTLTDVGSAIPDRALSAAACTCRLFHCASAC